MEQKEENKVRCARFPDDLQTKIDAYGEIFDWNFGQVVTHFLRREQRIRDVVGRIEILTPPLGQGDSMMVVEGVTPSIEVPEYALAYYLVEELKKSIAEGFRTRFPLMPWEE